MTRARQQNLLSQARHSFLQAVESLPIHRNDRIKLTCDEKRGLADLGSAENWHQFPIRVYVPIPVKCASEAGSLELFSVEVQICLSQPGRESFMTKLAASDFSSW